MSELTLLLSKMDSKKVEHDGVTTIYDLEKPVMHTLDANGAPARSTLLMPGGFAFIFLAPALTQLSYASCLFFHLSHNARRDRYLAGRSLSYHRARRGVPGQSYGSRIFR